MVYPYDVTFDYDYSGRRIAKEINGEPLTRILYFSEFAETEGGTLTKHFYAGDVLIASSHVDVSLAGGPAPLFEIPPEGWLVLGSVVAVLLLGAGLPLLRVAPERVLAVRAVGAVLLLLSAGPPVLLLPSPATAGGGGGGPPPPYLGMRHYHLDRLGSTQVVTDALGAILQQIRYDAYGVMRVRVDANGDPLEPGPGGLSNDARRTFTGYEDEWLSGLQYAGARFYDPELAQFLTHDPAGQFPSPYAYGPGDPANGTDPTGESFLVLGLMVGAFFAGVSVNRASLYGGESAAWKALGIAVATFALSYGVGSAGAVVGAGGGLIDAAASLASNPLVQNTLSAASVGMGAASFVSGGSTPEWMGIAGYALAGVSMGLAFASASSSAAANGAEESQGGVTASGATSGGFFDSAADYLGRFFTGEAREIFGGIVGTGYGIGKGLYGIGKGLVTGNLGGIGKGFADLGSALAMPRSGSHSGLGWPGTPESAGIAPGTGTKLNNASIWHDKFTGERGFGSAAQFGWIQRAWAGPGVELGPWGQAYRVLGTVGFGLAGTAQAAAGF